MQLSVLIYTCMYVCLLKAEFQLLTLADNKPYYKHTPNVWLLRPGLLRWICFFFSAAVTHICCIYIDAVAWACPVTATAHFANTLLLHHLTPSPTSLNKWLQWVSEGFSAPAKQNYITRSTKSGLVWVGNRLSEDRWGHTLSLSGFTVSRTFETPSFTVGVCIAVVFARELL